MVGKTGLRKAWICFTSRWDRRRAKKIQLAVMDMWKAFEKSARKNVPGAAILYDKFHVIRHLGDALDKYGR